MMGADLERRVTQLERCARLWRSAAVIMALGIGALLCVGLTMHDSLKTQLQGNQSRGCSVDLNNGPDGSCYLVFSDSTGETRLRLGLDAGGTPQIEVFDHGILDDSPSNDIVATLQRYRTTLWAMWRICDLLNDRVSALEGGI